MYLFIYQPSIHPSIYLGESGLELWTITVAATATVPSEGPGTCNYNNCSSHSSAATAASQRHGTDKQPLSTTSTGEAFLKITIQDFSIARKAKNKKKKIGFFLEVFMSLYEKLFLSLKMLSFYQFYVFIFIL